MNVNSTYGLNTPNCLPGVCLKLVMSKEAALSPCVHKAAVFYTNAHAQTLQFTGNLPQYLL